jgi:hypothetical protein
MSVPILVAVAIVVLAGIIALGVLLIVSRRQLKGTRRELDMEPSTPSLPHGAGTCVFRSLPSTAT